MSVFQFAVRVLFVATPLWGAAAHCAWAEQSPTPASTRGFLQRLQSRRVPQPHSGPLRHSEAPSLEGSAVEYLIITDGALAPEFERLAGWKTAKGVPALVRTLDDVVQSVRAGSDLAETIRNYIREAYVYWGVQFVLLGGDTDIIPARYVEVELLQLRRPLTELYYACLDGSWNADGDAFFGENPHDAVDLGAEVFVGRAPVSSVEEAALFVDKTLRHEWPEDTAFNSRMLLMAEVLFPSNWQPQGPPPSSDGALFAEEIAELVPPHLELTRLYEAHSLWEGASALSVAAGSEAIDAGYGSVVHIGHGYRYTLSLGDGSIDVSDARRFDNGARAGLFFMLNCTATAFDFESMAEALLLNPNGGATLVVGSAREAFPLAARRYQKEFFTEVFVRGERRVGVAMSRSRERIIGGSSLPPVELWTQLVYTLLGDPEAAVWSQARGDLTLSGAPAELQVGFQRLTLQVTNGDGPVANALVCVLKPDDDYRVARTDAHGEAVLELQLNTVGEAMLTLTAFDHLPVQTTLGVRATGVALGIHATGLTDDGGALGFGNHDGVLDAGETATLTLPILNAGSGTASAITATLLSEDAAVEVLQPTSAYPDLTPGNPSEARTPFEVRVADTLSDASRVRLRLDVQHDGGAETHRIELPVAAARPQLLSLRIDDGRAGNGDGRLDPGEEADLFYSVINRGGGAATAVQLRLEQPSAGLEVLAASAEVTDIPAAQRRESSTPLVVRVVEAAPRTTARLVLAHRQDAAGRVHAFEPALPSAPQGLRFGSVDAPDIVNLEWEPNTDADLRGYIVYRAPSEAGPFERVNRDVVLQSYYRDTGRAASTRYHYRVAALDAAFFEGPASAVVSVSTNPPQLDGWPLGLDDLSASTPAVGDVLGDGRRSVVTASRNVFAWDADGVELRDADHNALTWGVFYGQREVYGSVTLADLDPRPGREIVVSTWDPQRRFVAVVDGKGRDLPNWPRDLVPANEAVRGALVPPVVANIDADRTPEVLLAARDGRLYGWHADGREIADGDRDASTHGVLLDTGSPFLRCAPAVADLAPERPGQEIAIGSTDGKLYVLASDGTPLPGWPRTAGGDGIAFGEHFASGIVVADLDQDAQPEMVFLESGGRLHAMHVDGSELPGYPVAGLRSAGNSVTPSVAIGDLFGDAKLEVVAATSNGEVQVYDFAAQPSWSTPIASGASSESSPILGDVDGDGAVEIVFGNEAGLLHAWNLDASRVDGFPIAFGAEIRATPLLADLHGDGNCVLIVQAWQGEVSVLDLGVPWDEARFPWPMHRGNVQRTGEFGFKVPTPIVLADVSVRPQSDGRVVLMWNAVSDDGELEWSVRRAGPFETQPPLDSRLDAQLEEVGRLRGHGALHFEDRALQRARWYVYALVSFGAQRAEIIETRHAVRTAAPATLRLHRAFPNPFNAGTRLSVEIPDGGIGGEATTVRIEVFDVHGARVRTLLNEPRPAGVYSVDWDGRDRRGQLAASGVYVVQLRAVSGRRSQKVVRLR